MGHQVLYRCISHASPIQTQHIVKVIYWATWIPLTMFPVVSGRAQGMGKSKNWNQGPQQGLKNLEVRNVIIVRVELGYCQDFDPDCIFPIRS